MKPFFIQEQESGAGIVHARATSAQEQGARSLDEGLVCRLAVYDSSTAAPRVVDVTADTADAFIEEIAAKTYTAARDLQGRLPYTVIREVVENLIHADFREPVVSVLDAGNTVRLSDQGPGIPDKGRAILPGYTTATYEMKQVIRGVGSGLPLVREFLSHEGGSLALEDNLGAGAVVTLRAGDSQAEAKSPLTNPPAEDELSEQLHLQLSRVPRLSTRQKRVLSLVMEFGEAGPTLVSRELSVGLSTAYRDLAFLEENELISSDESGRRGITELGTAFLDSLFR